MFCAFNVMPYGDKKEGQYWVRWYLATWQPQAVTWTDVDFLAGRFRGIIIRWSEDSK